MVWIGVAWENHHCFFFLGSHYTGMCEPRMLKKNGFHTFVLQKPRYSTADSARDDVFISANGAHRHSKLKLTQTESIRRESKPVSVCVSKDFPESRVIVNTRVSGVFLLHRRKTRYKGGFDYVYHNSYPNMLRVAIAMRLCVSVMACVPLCPRLVENSYGFDYFCTRLSWRCV